MITRDEVQAKLDALAKPMGSLGHLEALAVNLAVASQSLTPLTRPRRLVLFAADHGVVAQSVTPWPSAVTTAMVETILNDKATSTALAKAHGVDVRVVNAGMVQPPSGPWPAHFNAQAIAVGTADLSQGPAMTVEQFDSAWALGEAEAQRAVDAGHLLLIAGEMGIGNTTAAACLTHALAGIDADTATGSGAGADAAMRTIKRDIVAAAIARLGGRTDKAALAEIAGFEIVAMAGFYAMAARQEAVILLDGYVTTAAALIAEQLCPGTRCAMLAGHLSAEPGHRAALKHLGLTPVLEWQMRLGEGSGALVALPLLDSAAALLCDVTRLADIGPDKDSRYPVWAAPVLAIQFLTRIPVPGTASLTPQQVAAGLVQAVGWFPLVGAGIGAITASVALAADSIWPALVAVLIALAIEAWATGAFHEDAVADFCDAFGGGLTADDVRRIMKDSRIGSYGSLGLILAVALRAALTLMVVESMTALSAFLTIIAAATFGRLLVVVLMTMVAPAPQGTGLAKDVASGVGLPVLVVALVTALPGLLGFAIVTPVPLLAASLVAAAFLLWFRALLLRRIGGSTGDCLGFVAYAGQLFLLLAATAAL